MSSNTSTSSSLEQKTSRHTTLACARLRANVPDRSHSRTPLGAPVCARAGGLCNGRPLALGQGDVVGGCLRGPRGPLPVPCPPSSGSERLVSPKAPSPS
jgi:hypothetical protein